MKTIVIVGGGFAGVRLARDLLRHPRDGWDILLISEESYTTFNPMLPEAVGAAVFPEHVVAPLRETIGIHRRGRFVMGRVERVDRQAGTVTCRTLVGDQTFAFDHLVLTLGTRAKLDLIPGMAQHALPLKTVGDAMYIRNVVLRRLAMMELENDPDRQRRLGHFVVLGGGFSGVEVAGALIDCLRGIARYYPRAGKDKLKITLLHGTDRLLPQMHPVLGEAALQSLRRRGVDVQLRTRATEVTADAVHLAEGPPLAAATIVATIGTQPNALLQTLDLPLECGCLKISASLQVEGTTNIWAAGDCAHLASESGTAPYPATAQVAVQQGALLARNLLATIEGRPTTAFVYRHRGSMAAVGHLNGVAEVFGHPISGFVAWLFWRAFYLMQMPTFGRKLRIFFEWAWGTFFPTDITHLRFARSRDVKTSGPG